MKVLVTGAAGFIGSHLCEALLKEGHTVVGLDNMNGFYDPEVKQGNLLEVEGTADRSEGEFIFYAGDIRHQDQVAQLLREYEFDCVFHLAAMAGVRPSFQNPLLYEDVNQLGTITMLEECRKAGIKRFIFASSSSVYGNNKKVPYSESDDVNEPISIYASTKRSGELLCHTFHKIYGLSVACLRFFTVFGPRQRPDLAIHKFTHKLYQGDSLPVYGDGSKSRDFTHIEDILQGVLGARDWLLKNDEPQYEIFNLGESKTISVKELISKLEKATGKTAQIEYMAEVPGDVQITNADISKAQEILGYQPKMSFDEGLASFVKWYEKRAGI